jgi:hypothetical protein
MLVAASAVAWDALLIAGASLITALATHIRQARHERQCPPADPPCDNVRNLREKPPRCS